MDHVNLDRDIITYFKKRVSETAKNYQALINDALRDYIGLGSKTDVLSDLVKRVRQFEKMLLKQPSSSYHRHNVSFFNRFFAFNTRG